MEKILTVDRLIIGSEQGPHIELTSTQVTFWQSKTHVGASLGLGESGPELTFFDDHRHERLSLSVAGDGTPHCSLTDGNGTPRLSSEILDDGNPFVEWRNATGTTRLEVSLEEDDNNPQLIFRDRTGAELHTLTLTWAGELVLLSPDGTGTRRCSVLARTRDT